MEDRRRTVRRKLTREANTVSNVTKNMVETSEIPQTTDKHAQYTDHTAQSGEILPKHHGYEGDPHITPKSGEIPPNQRETNTHTHTSPNLNEISPKETQEVTDLVAMEEGARVEMPTKSRQCTVREQENIQGNKNLQQKSPQMDTAQHYLEDNFSDVMRSSALGSNVSSLFNIIAFNTTINEQKVTLDWILLDGKNSQLETLRDKHITDFQAAGGSIGAMLVYLLDLELFYNTNEFLVDLQSGELFVRLKNRWHPTGLSCRKRNFDVDQLIPLIQHASIKLKNQLYRRKDEQTAIFTLDPTKAQVRPLLFIPSTVNYTAHSKPMSPTMRKNYVKDRAQYKCCTHFNLSPL